MQEFNSISQNRKNIFFIVLRQLGIGRTPTFSQAALPLNARSDTKLNRKHRLRLSSKAVFYYVQNRHIRIIFYPLVKFKDATFLAASFLLFNTCFQLFNKHSYSRRKGLIFLCYNIKVNG